MNLWLLFSTIILSLSLTTAPIYHFSTINLLDNEDSSQVELQDNIVTETNVVLPHKVDNKSLGVKIKAESAAAIDEESGLVLWQKNAEQIRSLASITKLMTALVFLEHNPGWRETITMEEKDEVKGGTAHILRGETVSVKNLFYTSLIASDNNATKALARSTGLETDKFVELMNEKAWDLGLSHTAFEDVTGLSDNNKSTALEILHLAKIAFANADIQDATKRSTYSFSAISGQAHKIFSTNLLLNSYLDILAGKTGHINAAGYCLVSKIQTEDGHNIIAVVLNSDSNDDRFQDMKILASWLLDNFVWS